MGYIQKTLNTLAQTESAKHFISRGYLPSMSKGAEHDAKWWGKQFLEFLGYSDKLQNGRDPFYHIDYADDKAIDMPMLMEQLRNKDSVNIENIKRLSHSVYLILMMKNIMLRLHLIINVWKKH